MQKNISFFSKINSIFIGVYFLATSNCIKIDKKMLISKPMIDNKQHAVLGKKMDKNITNDNKVSIKTVNLFNHKDALYNEDNEDNEEKADINYTKIDEGFFCCIFKQEKRSMTENCNCCLDGQCEIDDGFVDENDIEEKNSDININYDDDKLRVYELNITSLKEKLKIKEREKNICKVNKRLTITPGLKIITNKKRTYTINFSYKF